MTGASISDFLSKALANSATPPAVLGVAAVAVLGVLAWALALRRQLQEHRSKARRQNSREAMLQSRNRELLDVISDIILVLTADGRFFEVNRAGQRAFGASQEDLAGVSILSRVAPNDRPKIKRLLEGDNENLGDGILVLDVRDERGFSHMIQLTAWRPTESTGGGGFKVVARDVTALKAAEFVVAELHARLHAEAGETVKS